MSASQPWQMFPFFNDVAPEWGHKLWCFLTEPDSVAQMMRASDAGRPAVEGIAVRLHERLGDAVAENRVKQFTGLLVRRIMEENGYRFISHNHTCRENPVFSTGSLYERKRT